MNANPISVVAGNAGTATLNFTPGGNTGYVNGLITLNTHDLIVTATASQNQIRGGFTGTGNLTFTQAGSSLINVAAGTINTIGNITFSNIGTSGTQIYTTESMNNTGTITNNSTSSGLVTISAPIGSNVTAIVQNSTTSKMILSGANTSYAGTTTVSAGTLEIGTSNSLGAASSVIIATDAKMYLNFSGTNTVKSLKLGSSFKSKGVYNRTTDPTYFDATYAGSLNVTTGPAVGTMVRFF
jgi:autotransporter-associated beta strand protein